MKHCPRCNASSAERNFYGEFCEKCAGEALIGKLPSKLKVEVCKDCGKVHVGRDFIEFNRYGKEDLLRTVFKGYKAEPIEMRIGDSIWTVRVIADSGLEVEQKLAVEYLTPLCVPCSRRHAGYWEGVVQFRGDPGKIQTLIAALHRYLERREAFIAKVTETDTGFDVFASDKRLIQAFLSERRIKSTKSFTLYGQKGSRKIYRNTYSVFV